MNMANPLEFDGHRRNYSDSMDTALLDVFVNSLSPEQLDELVMMEQDVIAAGRRRMNPSSKIAVRRSRDGWRVFAVAPNGTFHLLRTVKTRQEAYAVARAAMAVISRS